LIRGRRREIRGEKCDETRFFFLLFVAQNSRVCHQNLKNNEEEEAKQTPNDDDDALLYYYYCS